MSGGITTSSILQAAIYAIQDGRIEDGLWRLELVMSDLKMAEQEHDQGYVKSEPVAQECDHLWTTGEMVKGGHPVEGPFVAVCSKCGAAPSLSDDDPLAAGAGEYI